MSDTSSFILILKLNTNPHQDKILGKRYSCGCSIYNHVCKYAKKQMPKLWDDKNYQELLSIRRGLSDKADISALNEQLKAIRMSYGLSHYQLYYYVKLVQHRYKKNIDSRTAQSIAKEVWRGCEKVLFKNGKTLHFHRYHDFDSMESNSNNVGITYKNGFMVWNKLKIPVQLDKSDFYECMALKNRIKYCRVIRKPIGTRYHYYLQLVLEGTPPIKHIYGTGPVGIDIGTSTCAVVSSQECDLFVLGEDVVAVERKIARLQRAMECSKRATNPDNFNPDGTVKKGRFKWRFSKNYKHLRFQKRVLESRYAASLKQSHERQANRVLEQGDEVFVENMCFKGLQRRAKETTKNSKGKFNRKKRFGKSIKNHAPAMFLSIIDRKLGYIGKFLRKVNTKSFRASQYNHVTNDYIKKRLHNRWQYFSDGTHCQRDLYSAFLLMNSMDDLQSTDRNKCLKTYETFKLQHDQLIHTLELSNKKLPASFGIKKAA